jgi:hypothetical protein
VRVACERGFSRRRIRCDDRFRLAFQPFQTDGTLAGPAKLIRLSHFRLHTIRHRLVQRRFDLRQRVVDGISPAFGKERRPVELDQFFLHHAPHLFRGAIGSTIKDLNGPLANRHDSCHGRNDRGLKSDERQAKFQLFQFQHREFNFAQIESILIGPDQRRISLPHTG